MKRRCWVKVGLAIVSKQSACLTDGVLGSGDERCECGLERDGVERQAQYGDLICSNSQISHDGLDRVE